MEQKIIGYHGTSEKAALNIIKTRQFKKSDKKNEWLGKGVYFYELLEKAQWWCQKKSNPTIIEANILVSSEKLLNLDNTPELDQLARFIKEMNESDHQFVFSEDKTERRCQLLNIYMEYYGYHVIIGTFVSTNKKYKKELNEIGYTRTEKQICVHNTDCIVYNELKVIC
ncbi:hypothetical protein MUA24_02070 [Staphylococcus aureus]|nr:hypothetical protein [Staphylococcus aureus]UXV47990.1 hypothetical protein MUA24_02070 [Staphylococcus aureus]